MSRLAACLLSIAVVACSSQRPATTPAAPVAKPAPPIEPAAAPPIEPAAAPPIAPAPVIEPAPAPPIEPIRITATDGLPADLVDEHPLWDVAAVPVRRPAPAGTRVYRDGRIYRYSNTRWVKGADGTGTTVEVPPAWRLVARLRRPTLAAVEREIRARIAAGLPDPVTLTPGQVHIAYRSWIDGREHTLLVQLAQPGGAYQLKATLVTPIEAEILVDGHLISTP